MLHVLGETLVHKQVELVLSEEGKGMQEQHTSAHVRFDSSRVDVNMHRADPIFRMFRTLSRYNFAHKLQYKNSAPKEVLFTIAEHK